MSYRNLRFLEYGMTNAIHYECQFACDSNPKRCNTIDIYTMDPAFVLQFLQETYKEKPQDLHMTSADILCLHRVDMEHHANDRNSRGVRQCA